jgi:predicted adenine nucleotide alpha hydrolase (AANH) superfamily ATPase
MAQLYSYDDGGDRCFVCFYSQIDTAASTTIPLNVHTMTEQATYRITIPLVNSGKKS